MARVMIDAAMLERLRGVQGPVELVDGEGRVVGRFVPAEAFDLEPRLGEEELRRREAHGGGRSLQAILADLEKRA